MEKTVLITGASGGIGEALAKLLAEKGYRLILTCRKSEEKLEQIREEILSRQGKDCRTFLCNLAEPDEVSRLFAQLSDVDILINNAAVSYVGLLSDMSVEDWRQVIDTNLNAVFYTCKSVIPGMLHKKNGKIINISSVWGNAGASMEVAYSAAKGGVNSFTKALAKELAPSNIQVNAVAFGMMDTQMNACFSAEEKQAIIEEIPADRMGTKEEAAQMVLKVIEAPSYLTGQIITMDGGWL